MISLLLCVVFFIAQAFGINVITNWNAMFAAMLCEAILEVII